MNDLNKLQETLDGIFDELQFKNRAALNQREAAKYLGVSQNTIIDLTKEGRIKVIRYGTRIIYPKKALEEFLGEAEKEKNNYGVFYRGEKINAI